MMTMAPLLISKPPLKFALNLLKEDGSIYRLRGVKFEQVANKLENDEEAMKLKKLRIGKYGKAPVIDSIRRKQPLPSGSIAIIGPAKDYGIKSHLKNVIAFYGTRFSSKMATMVPVGTVVLVLGYKHRRHVITYFDHIIPRRKMARGRRAPTRSLNFVSVARYAKVLIDDRVCLIWEGHLIHVPQEKFSELANIQSEIVARSTRTTSGGKGKKP